MKLVPVVRLFHVSDLHVDSRGRTAGATTARLRNDMKPLLRHFGLVGDALKRVEGLMTELLAGHNPAALQFLQQSIVEQAGRDPRWSGRTYLVVTGDVSNWGDCASVAKGCDFLVETCRRASLPEPLVIYGNHDVWIGEPGTIEGLPFGCLHRTAELERHHSDLRQRHFPKTWPLGPYFRIPIGSSGFCLAAYSLNTILHSWWQNGWALGRVGHDRYWESGTYPHQLDGLSALLQPQDVPLVLTHHPIHDSAPWPIGQGRTPVGRRLPGLANVLMNAEDVAGRLPAGAGHSSAQLRACVVLSGHTHILFPALGQLPTTIPHLGHWPLGPKQMQLTVGTATKGKPPLGRQTAQALGSLHRPIPHFPPNSSTPALKEQHWQMLHVQYDEDDKCLVVERIVLWRPSAAARFHFYDPLRNGMPAEQCRLKLG